MANYKVVNTDQLDADLKTVANAIREKSGTSDNMSFPDGFVDTVTGIPSADTSIEDSIITRTITEYTNNRVSVVGSSAFYSHRNLTTVNFPACATIFGDAFLKCEQLSTANFQACTNVYAYAFSGCTNLTTISFPALQSIASYAFYGCRKLTTVSFPACTRISANAFYSCNLTTFILTGSSIPELSNSNAFSKTPMSTTGYFYVPSSLITAYQSATNWAYFSSRFSAIEDLV